MPRAFWLRVYDHGIQHWDLAGEPSLGTVCPWDSVERAGYLILDEDWADGADFAAIARGIIEQYNAWLSGDMWVIVERDALGDVTDAIGGFFGLKQAEAGVSDYFGDVDFDVKEEV